MSIAKGMSTSISPHYGTPSDLYRQLDAEFHFDHDPCQLSDAGIDGLLTPWGKSNFVNPPYGKHIGKWVQRGLLEAQQGNTSVFLIPSRTGSGWWHEYVMRANEIRLVKGRVTFIYDGLPKHGTPFDSVVVIFRFPLAEHPMWTTIDRHGVLL